MEDLLYLIEKLGVALAITSSTFAIAFYFSAIKDGVIDASEKRFMHIGYTVLRIGMGFIIATFVLGILKNWAAGNGAYFTELFWFLSLLLIIIVGNAVLMTLHKAPNWLAPFLQAGSWYAYFFVYTLQPGWSFLTLVLVYLLWIVALVVAFNMLKARLTKKPAA